MSLSTLPQSRFFGIKNISESFSVSVTLETNNNIHINQIQEEYINVFYAFTMLLSQKPLLLMHVFLSYKCCRQNPIFIPVVLKWYNSESTLVLHLTCVLKISLSQKKKKKSLCYLNGKLQCINQFQYSFISLYRLLGCIVV